MHVSRKIFSREKTHFNERLDRHTEQVRQEVTNDKLPSCDISLSQQITPTLNTPSSTHTLILFSPINDQSLRRRRSVSRFFFLFLSERAVILQLLGEERHPTPSFILFFPLYEGFLAILKFPSHKMKRKGFNLPKKFIGQRKYTKTTTTRNKTN